MEPSPHFPPIAEPPLLHDDASDRIQMNAATAMAVSDNKKTFVQQLMIGGGAVIIFMLSILGGLRGVREAQNTSVGASFDLKHSVEGKVVQVEPNTNQFYIEYDSSQDESITRSGLTVWTVALPPGESMSLDTSKYCFTWPDQRSSVSDAKSVSCQSIILPGQHVIVEYAVLKMDEAYIVAKSVIKVGQYFDSR